MANLMRSIMEAACKEGTDAKEDEQNQKQEEQEKEQNAEATNGKVQECGK